MKTKMTNAGFTLVEILIVVVILGILAAIVIPQFSQASTEARENALRADLQTVRSQIELYKIQHADDLPGTVSGVDFETAMTGTTDINGATSGSDFGPYLQQIPTNPFSVAAIANLVDEGTTDPTAVSTTGGWFYNTSDAGFMAVDDTDHLSW